MRKYRTEWWRQTVKVIFLREIQNPLNNCFKLFDFQLTSATEGNLLHFNIPGKFVVTDYHFVCIVIYACIFDQLIGLYFNEPFYPYELHRHFFCVEILGNKIIYSNLKLLLLLIYYHTLDWVVLWFCNLEQVCSKTNLYFKPLFTYFN